jgi:hypothetical protein
MLGINDIPELKFRTVEHSAYNHILVEIAEAVRLTKKYGESQSIPLEGQTRSGKTRLAEQQVFLHPAYWTATGIRIPIWYVQIPEYVTDYQLARYMLRQFGDPLADIPDVGEDTFVDPEETERQRINRRLDQLIRDCVEDYVFLDDLHHLQNIDTPEGQYRVSEWIKNRIKNSKKTFVIAGLVGTLRKLLQVNTQFDSLFTKVLVLEPFQLNFARDKSEGEKQRYLAEVQAYDLFVNQISLSLGVPLYSKVTYDLTQTNPQHGNAPKERVDLLHRLHYATNGVVGNLVNLLIYAESGMHRYKSEIASKEVLSWAFKTRLQKPSEPELSYLGKKCDPFDPVYGETFNPNHADCI